MSGLYEEFEKRFTGGTFSAGWVEVEVKAPKNDIARKDLATLEAELQNINNVMEEISLKQLRLSNLAKLYDN